MIIVTVYVQQKLEDIWKTIFHTIATLALIAYAFKGLLATA